LRISRHGGFTLVEVVVAFALLGLVLMSGFEIFAQGMSRASELEDLSRALAIAQSRLAAAGTEELPKEGEARGDSDDRRFHWAQTVQKSDEGQDPSKPVQGAYILYRVGVRVDWRTARGRDQNVALATYVLGNR
jgi:general secretion pathway protein I